MEYVLGIDLGTSYFKVGLFDRSGELCGFGRVFVSKDTDNGGRCELPVDRFWSLLRQALGQARKQAQAQAEDIRGAAYSSQANSFLLLDKKDEPLTPLILWPDSRVEKVDPAVKKLWRRDDYS